MEEQTTLTGRRGLSERAPTGASQHLDALLLRGNLRPTPHPHPKFRDFRHPLQFVANPQFGANNIPDVRLLLVHSDLGVSP